MVHSIYLAGPDVFRPDAAEHGQRLQALCAEFGLEGLYPLGNKVPAEITDSVEQAAWIYRADIELLDRADAVLANLDFFRGPEPDSGTCFEVGYAVAKGKPVYGYLPEDGDIVARLRKRYPQVVAEDGKLDAEGWSLEEFGMPLNLMLAVPATLVVGDARAALTRLRQDYPAA